MSLLQLRKDGWLDGNLKEIDLPYITDEQVNYIKNGNELIIENCNELFLIYVSKNESKNRLIIRRFPIAPTV